MCPASGLSVEETASRGIMGKAFFMERCVAAVVVVINGSPHEQHFLLLREETSSLFLLYSRYRSEKVLEPCAE